MVADQPATADAGADTVETVDQAPPATVQFGYDDLPELDTSEPETEVSAAPPETETPEPPETPEAAPQEPEKPDLAALLADLPDDEFEKLDRVSRSRESVRRRAEAETARRVHTEQESNFAAGNYAKAIADYVRKAPVEDGTTQIDSQQFDAIAGDMWGAASRMAYRAATGVLREVIDGEYRIPASLQNRLDATQDEVTRGQKPLEALLKVQQEIALAAGLEAERPKLRKEIEAEVRAELAQSKVVEQRRSASETNASQAAPTQFGASTTTTTAPRDFDHAEELWLDGQLPYADYKKWRERSNIAPSPR